MKKFAFWLLFTFSLNFSTIAISGDSVAGAKKYNAKCKQCHGPAGKGIASYPRIYGKEISMLGLDFRPTEVEGSWCQFSINDHDGKAFN